MKAILVVDLPDDFVTKTAIAIVDVQNEKGEGVIAMCPLKPLPQKVEVDKEVHLNYRAMNKGYQCGWNACLKEITGETE